MGGSMPIYTEKEDKLKLELSDSGKQVKIKITCYYKTTVGISTSVTDYDIYPCKKLAPLGKTGELKGKTVSFDGTARNPDLQNIRIKHKIYEVGGKQITYTIPDDYTGDPDFDGQSIYAKYRFFVKMR